MADSRKIWPSKASITSISRIGSYHRPPAKRASRASAGQALTIGRQQSAHHEHHPDWLLPSAASKASITSISRTGPYHRPPAKRASRASAGLALTIGRQQSAHHEHHPDWLLPSAASKARITSITRTGSYHRPPAKRASRASAGQALTIGRQQSEHHEHQPDRPYHRPPAKRASRASAGLALTIGRQQSAHHEHHPDWLLPSAASKASITSISRTGPYHRPPAKRASRASPGLALTIGRQQSEHHEHQPDRPLPSAASKASITSISRTGPYHRPPAKRASRASAGLALTIGRQQSEHHEHQPDRPLPSAASKASITSISRTGSYHRLPAKRASRASAGLALTIGRQQSEHHEHQPDRPLPSAASKAGSTSISRTGPYHRPPAKRASRASARLALTIGRQQSEHHEHQPDWLLPSTASKASITSITRSGPYHRPPAKRASRASAGLALTIGRQQASRASAGVALTIDHQERASRASAGLALTAASKARITSITRTDSYQDHQQSEHHEHQPDWPLPSAASKASITSISRTGHHEH